MNTGVCTIMKIVSDTFSWHIFGFFTKVRYPLLILIRGIYFHLNVRPILMST